MVAQCCVEISLCAHTHVCMQAESKEETAQQHSMVLNVAFALIGRRTSKKQRKNVYIVTKMIAMVKWHSFNQYQMKKKVSDIRDRVWCGAATIAQCDLIRRQQMTSHHRLGVIQIWQPRERC
jgi:hypothetical protein